MSKPVYEIPVTEPMAPGKRELPPEAAAAPSDYEALAPPGTPAAPAPAAAPAAPPAAGLPASTAAAPPGAQGFVPAPSDPVLAMPAFAAPVTPGLMPPPVGNLGPVPVASAATPGLTPAPSVPLLPMPEYDASLPPLVPQAAAPTAAFVEDEFTIEARRNADPDLIAAMQEVLFAGASDLHVSADTVPLLRVDGSLRPASGDEVWSRDRVAAALLSILRPEQLARFEEVLELDFAFTLSANARFRVNYYQQRGVIGGAFRIIPTEIKSLKTLGVPESVGEFSKLPRGLVLVTGPTGSGKSTTLAALVDIVNANRSDHIVTVEDPIEFLHQNKRSLVNQREVGHDTHSFANALKHVLRQDPDVILIGELRDLETISVALTAAETGHLVFATLHTQDAAQTIDRVIDVFPPHQQGQVRAQLAATLQGVVTQTLVKHASGSGRAVATEVLIANPAIQNLIREGKTYQVRSTLQASRAEGMHTMDQSLADLVNTGVISYGAAVERVQDLEDFKRLVHRTGDADKADAAFAGDFEVRR